MRTTFPSIEYSQPQGFTREANALSISFSNALCSYIGTSIVISKKYEMENFRKFVQLKDRWKSETLFVSSGSIIISNSAYQDIIGLGRIAIPWIIRELKKDDDHWFYALEKITGSNPIQKENIGKISEMKKDWIAWATNHYNL